MRKFRLSLAARGLWLLGVLLATVSAAAAEQPGTGRLERFLQGLDTFSADFEQQLVGDDGEVLETSAGKVYIQRPGRFHWHYTKPYSQYLISDGRSLWVYDVDLEQVTVRDVAGSIDDTPAAILGGDVDLDRYYTVSDVEEEGEIDWIRLTPRDRESQYQSVRLGFHGEGLTEMVLHDSLGQQTWIRFRNVRRNGKLDEGLFEFEPPEGVDVIDER